MRIEPTFDRFAAIHTTGQPTVVWTTTVADLETPVAAYMKLCGARTHTFLLESVEGGASRGRYSMIGFDPDLVFRAQGEVGTINRQFATDPEAFEPVAGRSYDALKQLILDVQTGKADYAVILVYDVSRWGRFQDVDESAYYEYVLKRAGIRVHYCAEQFENDGSMSSSVLKTLKRSMAAEYSREQLECPAFFEPVSKRETVIQGAKDGTTEEAYG